MAMTNEEKEYLISKALKLRLNIVHCSLLFVFCFRRSSKVIYWIKIN